MNKKGENINGTWALIVVTFGDVWVDDTRKGDPVKFIEIDLSSAKYSWQTEYTTSISKPVTQIKADKAVKLIKNGRLVIKKNGKFYNATGVEIK